MQMQFIQSFFLVASSLLLLLMALYAFKHRERQGAFAFFILLLATVIWSIGSLLEISVVSFKCKIFWRNIQQIGVFILPISTVFFATIYTRSTKYLKYVYIAAIPSILSILLIFTNDSHHLMRSGYTLVDSLVYGKSLVVHLTLLGSILVSYNFLLPFFAIFILLDFSRKVSSQFRSQVYLLIFGFILTFIMAWLKTAILEKAGIFIQIAVLSIPSSIIIFYCLFRHRTFNLSPIARDKVFEVINQGIIIMDETGTMVDINSFALNCLEKRFNITSPLGSKLKEVNNQISKINTLIESNIENHFEICIKKEPEPEHLSLSFYPLYHNKDEFIGSVLIINDITAQKLLERTLEERAEKDYLTRLLNKFGFEKAIQQHIFSKNQNDVLYSILMIDLDNFKQLNDTSGHADGDKILCHFADTIMRTIRPNDIASRIGGDEFVIVLPNTKKGDAFKIAERLRKIVATSYITLNNNKRIRYTISIGVADNRTSLNKFDEVLKQADKALYEAKNKSRNCSVIF